MIDFLVQIGSQVNLGSASLVSELDHFYALQESVPEDQGLFINYAYLISHCGLKYYECV